MDWLSHTLTCSISPQDVYFKHCLLTFTEENTVDMKENNNNLSLIESVHLLERKYADRSS